MAPPRTPPGSSGDRLPPKAGSTRKGPPPLPPELTKTLNAGAAFNQFILKHKGLKPYADLIWKWSRVYGIDAVELAALIQFESGGKADARSKANALGLAQIHMPTWKGKEAWKGSGAITEASASNPAFAVRFAAWYFSQKKAAFGSFDEAYRKGYNPGYTGPGPTPLLPKGYVPRTGTLSPKEEASVGVERAAETAAITNVWAVRTKDGVKFVQAAVPPKGTVRFDGQPVSQHGFLTARKHYEAIYEGYVGKKPTDAAIAHIMNSGLSDGGLMKSLSKSPNFKRGSIYQAHGPGLILRAKQLYGENWKPDDEFIRQAIVYNWSEATLVKNLRARPEYLKGPVFKKGEAGLLNVYQSIMGTPDEGARISIKEAVLGGWDADQFAAFLRGRPEYTSSPEYQSKALTFLDAMGLLTGRQAVLRPGEAEKNTNPAGLGPLPDSARIPGTPYLTRPSNLVPGGSLG